MAVSPVLSVGEVAKRSGVAVSALHFYEQKGLISSERSAGNQRRYSRAVLRRIAIIKVAQHCGVSLAEVGKAFEHLPKDRTPNTADWARMSKAWTKALTARVHELEKLRDQLDQCIGCGCLSVATCPLRNHGDELRKFGAGARLLEENES